MDRSTQRALPVVVKGDAGKLTAPDVTSSLAFWSLPNKRIDYYPHHLTFKQIAAIQAGSASVERVGSVLSLFDAHLRANLAPATLVSLAILKSNYALVEDDMIPSVHRKAANKRK